MSTLLIWKIDLCSSCQRFHMIDGDVNLFFLLFEPKAVRITPPLTINKKEIIEGCKTIIKVLNTL